MNAFKSSLVLALLAALVAFGATIPAHAVELKLTGGLSKYKAPPSGLWWDEKEEHDNGGLETTYVKASAVFPVSARTSIAINAFDLGKYHQKGWARPDSGPLMGGAPDLYETKGRITGVSLTGILHTKESSGFGLYGEAGLTYYRETFNLDRSDGFNFQFHGYGPGYTIGAGVTYGSHWKIGTELYDGNKAGASMNGHGFPSGKGRVTIPVAVSYSAKF